MEEKIVSTTETTVETFETDDKHIALSTLMIDQIIRLHEMSLKATSTDDLIALSLTMAKMIKCYIGLENLNTG